MPEYRGIILIARSKPAANWTSENPVLLQNEIAIETGTTVSNYKIKIGDGLTAWNSIPYFAGGTFGGDLQAVTDAGNSTTDSVFFGTGTYAAPVTGVRIQSNGVIQIYVSSILQTNIDNTGGIALKDATSANFGFIKTAPLGGVNVNVRIPNEVGADGTDANSDIVLHNTQSKTLVGTGTIASPTNGILSDPSGIITLKNGTNTIEIDTTVSPNVITITDGSLLQTQLYAGAVIYTDLPTGRTAKIGSVGGTPYISLQDPAGAKSTTIEAGTLTGNRNNTSPDRAGEFALAGDSTPGTLSGGAGAGTGPTLTLAANPDDNGGQIQILTGSAPAAGAKVVRYTYHTPYIGRIPKVMIVPANDAAAVLTSGIYANNFNLGYFEIYSTGALAPATTYAFTYIVIR